ncbi:hypothetical protein K378_01506 [Streptomyces sp. Amel2xB2]|nr:hypothetical protein K378_01506 [Streptomyces sp. Amel2xB2]
MRDLTVLALRAVLVVLLAQAVERGVEAVRMRAESAEVV